MKVIPLVAKDLRRQLHDRKAVVVYLALPLLLSAIMGLSFGGGVFGRSGISAIPVAMVGADVPQALRDQLAQGLQESGFFAITWEDSATAERQVREGDVKAAVVLPHNLLGDLLGGRDVEIALWKDPNSEIKAGIVETILRSVLRRYQAGEAAYRALWPADDLGDLGGGDGPFARLLDGDPLPFFRALRDPGRGEGRLFLDHVERTLAFGEAMRQPRVALAIRDRSDWEAADETAASRNLYDYFLPSFAVFFMMFGAAAAVRDLHREREHHTLGRVLLAPVSTTQVLLGKWGTAAVAGTGQLIVLFAAGAVLFGVPVLPHVGALLVTIVLSCGAAGSVYLVLATLVRTEKAMDTLATVFTLTSGMLGGNFFPVEVMPPALHVVGRLTFNYWANVAFNDIVVHGRGLGGLTGPLLALLGVTLVGLAIGLVVLGSARRRGVLR